MIFSHIKTLPTAIINNIKKIKKFQIAFFVNYFSGAGGGTIFLNVTNLLEIDGALSANGANALPQGGGGSGGSVWVYCFIIKGYGKITANGGSSPPDTAYHYHGGGGAGGRIAVYFKKNDTFSYFR